MNWLGIRTWAPAVRHATNGLNQGTVAVRTGLTSAARYPFVLQRERKKTPRLGFPHGTGFTLSFQRLCIGFSPYRSDGASLCSPLPERWSNFIFRALCAEFSKQKGAREVSCVFTVYSNNLPLRGHVGSDTACSRISSF